ncbi:glycosyltransferase involved in cell wall biosynthesis [Salinibacter ruber]|uniref:glycosyltransferase family 4 protein n=1 Tax=Salinibacter ruber TaxID=146919 RepID=UPI0021680CE3|nr:glycosyltransferase family 4 protein [Salinibacter ruber]MCS3708345.1 glycosyltransferase involved in cell wall biosynthesis [Salinibacter ruber]
MRILAPHPDSFGGYGGIAAASRQFLRALCEMDATEEVVALPRNQPETISETLPDALTWEADSAGGVTAFVQALLRRLAVDRDFDLIWCGHLHLVPFALLARRLTGAPIVVHVHGIEAWEPTEKWLVNRLVSRVDHFISVSETTKERLVAWSGLLPEQGTVVPNTIDFDGMGPGPKSPELLDRYDLHDCYVLMTMGRLVGKERRKGFDRVLDVLPAVAEKRPDVAYTIAGKGPDRSRLETKAERLGVRDRVVFTGYVPEDEKADHFRLADRFVMPSEGEGFGLVLLEALACGTPVIASDRDGGREAVAHGDFGKLVDPRDSTDLVKAILSEQTPPNPTAVRDRFGLSAYQARAEDVVSAVSAGSTRRMVMEP